MKKFVIIAAVFCLLTGGVLAAPAAKKAEKPSKLEITTITKEKSTADYPGVLVPGSLSGTSVFVSDYANFPNTALLEYINGSVWGIATTGTDFGQIGISLSPAPFSPLWGVAAATPVNVFGIQYGNNISGMALGASLLYGTNRNGSNLIDVSANGVFEYDTEDNASQYIGGRIGANVAGIDLSAGLSLSNNMITGEAYVDSSNWNYWEQYDDSKMLLDLAARINLGNGFTAVASLAWLNGSDKYFWKSGNWYGLDDYTEETYNSKLSFQTLIGKDIKANETLTIRMATGFTADGNTDAKYKYTDNLNPDNSYVGYFSYWNESSFEIPLFVAVEGKLNDTWSFNTGINTVILNIDGEKDATNTDYYIEKIREHAKYDYFDIDPAL
ncbi:MAG TPA: hypothetical protein PKZ78_01505, partial [Candidatus Goldiibacteriota bacterium]|nr:hypothetical protein [Candidatus Goldiibacteriota bacterium]